LPTRPSAISPGREFLASFTSETGWVSIARLVNQTLQRALFESFRTGRGAPYNDPGADHAVGESRFSAPWMLANLVPVILAGLDGVPAKRAAGGRVADVGCGSGKALLGMARAYPKSDFHGYDSAPLAIGFAEANLAESGVGNTTFHHAVARLDRATCDEMGDHALLQLFGPVQYDLEACLGRFALDQLSEHKKPLAVWRDIESGHVLERPGSSRQGARAGSPNRPVIRKRSDGEAATA
jgi:hypothetical protein